MVEFNTTNNGSLLDIRVDIVKALLDSLLKILSNTFKPQRAQASESQSSYLMVVHLLDVHPEGIDSKDG